MAIHQPGVKFRRSRLLRRQKGKRDVVAILSLTAMVDMFTVLVVFLLQNYNVTGQVLFLPKEVTLPRAEQIKELAPAVVVTISSKEVLIDKTPIVPMEQLKAQTDWMIQPLYQQVTEALKKAKAEFDQNVQTRLQKAVENARGEMDQDPLAWNKVTIQADKGIDFLTVKKVMFTVSEAGAREINFAVTKERTPQ
ncbi:MAG: ExbD/TolR family protein [Pseudobdellovibrionaceae bacterium]